MDEHVFGLEAREVMDEIIARAKGFFRRLAATSCPTSVEPGRLWQETLQANHLRTIEHATRFEEVIEVVTRENYFTVPTLNSDPIQERVIEGFLRWFDDEGTPLETMDSTIQESPYTCRDVIVTKGHRAVSTAFFWHLGAAHRIGRHVPAFETVLELGGGYGGLARLLKLQRPTVRYVILDMPAALFFSYVFLRANFPHANVLLVEEAGQLDHLRGDFDFALVPSNFVEEFKGRSFDLVVNTASLSEMTQPAYDRYMRLIQEGLRIDYFYNINRYGKHYDGLNLDTRRWGDSIGDDGCASSAAMDQHWKILFWDLFREDGFKQIDPRYMNFLEVLVRRIPPALRNEDFYCLMSDTAFAEAESRIKVDDTWHRLMWDATRFHPNARNLDVMIQVMSEKRFPQAAHYEHVRRRLAAS